MKTIVKQYFNFTKKETTAAITLCLISAVCIALPYFTANQKTNEKVNPAFAAIATNTFLVSNDSTNFDNASYSTQKSFYNKKETEKHKLTPFEFNPNTLSANGWQQLGLPQKTINTILNYLSKGGYFKTPEDIRKIWGLQKEDADILIPYITITHQPATYKNNTVISKNVPQSIDINTAAVEDFKQLPLVGNLAYKIVKYRDKLGGFININQIKETYNLPDSIYTAMLPYLKLQSNTLTKININTASDFDLGGHPYITKDVAKAIVIYRTQHGNYKNVADLKKIIFLSKDVIEKISPYLTVD